MRLGALQVDLVSDGTFLLDGGTMFGPVPKVLWSRKITPDDQNRIVLATNCCLVRTGTRTILIETGLGTKLTAKQRAIYGVPTTERLLVALGRLGVRPEAVDTVILTHLHLDHAGGATRGTLEGTVVPTFPRARYLIQREEWEGATHPTEFTKGSYWPENFRPLEEAGCVDFLEGDSGVCDGVRVSRTGGHTSGHQIVLIESGGEGAVFLGDLVPTTAHLRLPWTCAYDHHPVELVEIKRRWLARLAEQRSRCVWYHDVQAPMTYVGRSTQGEFVAEPEPGAIGVKGSGRPGR